MARTHPITNNFTAGELSPQLHYQPQLDIFPKGCRDLKNMVVRVNGPAKKREGTYYIAAVKNSAHYGLLIPFEYSTEQAYIIEAGNEYFRFYANGGQVQDTGVPVEVATPYAHDELSGLKFAQVADTMYMVNPRHQIHKLTRTDATTFTMTAIDIQDGPWLKKQNGGDITIGCIGIFTGTGLTITASDDLFVAGHVGAYWRFVKTLEVQFPMTATGHYTEDVTLDDGESVQCYLSGTWAGTVTLQTNSGSGWYDYLKFTTNTTFEIVSSEDDYQYRWYFTSRTSGTCVARLVKNGVEGICKITAVTNATNAVVTVVKSLTTTITDETDWYEGAWSPYRGYPSAICFHEQRMVVAGTTFEPQTIWGSKVGDFESMAVGLEADDDAYNHTLASQNVNAIRWLHSGSLLLIGTTGGTWTGGSTDADTPMTPSAPNLKKASGYGAADIQAIDVGEAPIYLRRAGKNAEYGWELMAIGYELATDKWQSRSISDRAEHLMAAGITSVAYADQPIPTLWMVRRDGDMVSATIDLAKGVLAFSEHLVRSGDAYESVATIPGSDRDEVWLLAKRSINGSDARYIEQITSHAWAEVDDAIYLDCAITYDGAAVTTITGLDHLIGEDVGVLSDGANHPDRTVDADGEIDLTGAATKVQIGLKYAARIRPTRIEAGTQSGSSQGAKRFTSSLKVALLNSLGLKFGTDLEELDEYSFRMGSDPMDAAPPLYTGEVETGAVPGGYDLEGSIYLVNDYPLPFEVASIRPTMQASDL